jgi:hypothetical protein
LSVSAEDFVVAGLLLQVFGAADLAVVTLTHFVHESLHSPQKDMVPIQMRMIARVPLVVRVPQQ